MSFVFYLKIFFIPFILSFLSTFLIKDSFPSIPTFDFWFINFLILVGISCIFVLLVDKIQTIKKSKNLIEQNKFIKENQLSQNDGIGNYYVSYRDVKPTSVHSAKPTSYNTQSNYSSGHNTTTHAAASAAYYDCGSTYDSGGSSGSDSGSGSSSSGGGCD